MTLDLEVVRARLPGREIHWFETIDSTMPKAARLAALGCPSGTVVGAEQQTAGQGRLGRKWHSEPDAGLYVSLVLRPDCTEESLPVLTLATGLAVQEAILGACGLVCDLRWPNDLLLDAKKCAGILLQIEPSAVVAGIGINVNHTSLPADLTATATSLRLAAGREISRTALLVALVEAVDHYSHLLSTQGPESILRLFSQASTYVSGRRVRVEQGDQQLEGVTAGLDSSGFLLLRRPDGRICQVLAGGVRPV